MQWSRSLFIRRIFGGAPAVRRAQGKYIMKPFIFLVGLLVLSSCRDTIAPVRDQSYILRGSVIDTIVHKPVAGVYIGFRNPNVPDSTFFIGDSLKDLPPTGFRDWAITDSGGYFEITWFLAARDTSLYKYLVAYKSGYQLWRYDHAPISIGSLGESVDTLQLTLFRKFGLDIPGTRSSIYLRDSSGVVRTLFQSHQRMTLVYTFTNGTGSDIQWVTASAYPWVQFYIVRDDSIFGDSFAGKAFAAVVVYGALSKGDSHVVKWSSPDVPVLLPGQYKAKAIVYFRIVSTIMLRAPDIETTFTIQP